MKTLITTVLYVWLVYSFIFRIICELKYTIFTVFF